MAKKLLLAEDSLTIQKVFSLTFAQSPISLTMVDNGEDAIRLAGEISPDLVVADVTLPDRNGFEVATAVRETEATRSCPILILAGSLPPFDEEKFRQCGADAVLFKPFESQELIDKVDLLLRGKEEPVAAAAAASAPAEELWDFSDVMDEVEEEDGRTAVAQAGTELLGAQDPGTDAADDGRLSLGEYDVSLEEIAGDPGRVDPGAAAFAEPPESGPEKEPPPLVSEPEDLLFDDSPPAVTDLTPAVEAAGAPEAAETPPDAWAPEEPAQVEPAPADEPEILPIVPEPPAFAEEPAAPAAGTVPDEEAIRAEFSARAREILERVAAETVEKVMWEMMDRLSAELSEKIREAVEAVAWDVIPATAESLIREEIERIRAKAAEQSS